MPKSVDSNVIDDLIGEVGGVDIFAAEIGRTRQTVWEWRAFGLPEIGRFKIVAWAAKRKIKLPAEFIK